MAHGRAELILAFNDLAGDRCTLYFHPHPYNEAVSHTTGHGGLVDLSKENIENLIQGLKRLLERMP